jgi:hypothetical protein
MQYQIGPPPLNPLSRLLAGIVAVLALAGAFFFGVFILIFAMGLGLVAWLALRLRMWWIRRKLGVTGSGFPGGQDYPGTAPSEDKKGDVIDAEYTVVSRQDED